jgi:hypothetical protein
MAPEKELTAAGDHEVLHLAILGNCEEGWVVVREFALRLPGRVGFVVVVIAGGPWSWVSEFVEDIFCMAARKATGGCAALTAAYSRRITQWRRSQAMDSGNGEECIAGDGDK